MERTGSKFTAASAQPFSSARFRTLRPMRSAKFTKTRQQQARAGWQEQLNKGADYTAAQRAALAADPKLHTQFACVFKTLQQGRPITHHILEWLNAKKRRAIV